MADPGRSRRRRRTVAILLSTAVALGLAAAAAPRLLSTPPARRWLLARANATLAPGKVEFATFRTAWAGPTVMTGFRLIDPEGDRVVDSPRATWDRGLWRILTDRPRYGTLALGRAALDIERHPDGRVDLYEALRPILKANRQFALAIRIEGGTLRVRAPGLVAPVAADRADITLNIPAAPAPLTWDVRLASADAGLVPSGLDLRGSFDRWREIPGAGPELTLAVSGRRWPLAVAAAGVAARARFDGEARVERREGRWTTRGEAAWLRVEASGPTLNGDAPRLDRVDATWDIGLTNAADGWTIRSFELKAPSAEVRVVGTLPASPGDSARVEGHLDLAALAAQIPRTLRLREGLAVDRGRARFRVESRSTPAEQAWEVEAHVVDLRAREGTRWFALSDPADLNARVVIPTSGPARVDRVALKTPFLEASGSGDVDRGVEIRATADLAALRANFGELIDLGDLDLAGEVRLDGGYRRQADHFEARLAIDLSRPRLIGVADRPLGRDSARVEARLDGPVGPEGFPRGWKSGRVGVTSGTFTADLGATSHPDSSVSLDASGSGPVSAAGRAGLAEGTFAARWTSGRLLAIDKAGLELRAAEGGRSVGLSATGRLDLDAGLLELDATPGGGPVMIGPDGLRFAGLGSVEGWKGEGSLVADLGPLDETMAAWSGAPPSGVAGRGTIRASLGGDAEGLRLAGRAELVDLAWAADGGADRRAEGPISLDWQASRAAGSDRLDLNEFVFASRYATLEASGRVADLGGRRVADLRGRFAPGWEAVNAWLAEQVEPGASASGRAREFRLSGPLAGATFEDVLLGLEAEFGFDLDGAKIHGLSVGPAPVVARVHAGRLALLPVDTTVNEGRLRLEADVDLAGKDGGASIRISPGSSLEDAQINDDVSRHFLAYVAPILADATRVKGRVSVGVREAELPIGPGSTRSATFDGSVVFRDVEFGPGPLADTLLDAIGPNRAPILRLDQPVQLTIAEGRVNQRGLSVPIGNLSRLELEGWVDFDRNIALTAGLPITPALVANNPLLVDIAAGTTLRVPVRGTLSQPQIDRGAMAAHLGDLGKTLLKRGAVRGATELLLRLGRRGDPAVQPTVEIPALAPMPDPKTEPAPPKPTAAERKAIRQERRDERRRKRDLESRPLKNPEIPR